MKKRTLYTEVAYLLGIVLVAAGAMFMERSDFGVSIIVAPAYILYRWLSPLWPVVTFGMAEYCFQALLILGMTLVLGHFQVSYLLSFATAVLYGFVLDGFMALGVLLPAAALWQRGSWYVLGMVLCAAGVAMMFHTYLSPEAYELFVKEVSGKYKVNINAFKTGYDCVSCTLGIVMSFCIFGFGHFVGVKWGTIACALINGFIISRFSALYERLWTFRDALPWRSFFTGEQSRRTEEAEL